MISIDDLEKIIKIVDKADISHFEFQQGESKVVIDKNLAGEFVVNKAHEEVIKSKIQTVSEKIDEESKEKSREKEFIKAAFAGTFYSTKEKGEPPFVKINDKVDADTVVGLIEVMKLFNEVDAGTSGTIVDILVNDGDFVEYGQPLFEIKVNDE